ncbi:hypothetical protein K227x_60990 [Rubripirellula lacrimiformis]|uniref:Type II secretion system protein G n=1 Tax=Rubripirellula lacrimiformis TaxID=1930273 RepID=A0A517NKK4_9BACT|nr:prepilin-type N-terminal cleavage/methylation domain-containing protein [Rubripirellula lacrimiformis]QDT07671.1 hypothetical protein K227x_60990 [Rubripirellula lacrimiformis]
MIRPLARNHRRGFSLIEILAALMIAATVATIAVTQFRTPGDTAHSRSCELGRQILQNEVQRHVDTTGSLPATDMRQLTTAEYWGTTLPACPVTGNAYTLDRSGNVTCATHP